MRRLLGVLGVLVLLAGSALAAIDTYEFQDPEKEQRYKELVQELRCLVCQNQNIADSNAELAKDLRRKTYEMVQAGRSKEEIADWMVARYGNFVLYKPPLEAGTLLLWVGPFLIFLVGVWLLIRIIRRRPDAPGTPLLSEEERRRAEALLAQGDEGDEDR